MAVLAFEFELNRFELAEVLAVELGSKGLSDLFPLGFCFPFFKAQ